MPSDPAPIADYVADCSGCEKRRGEEKMADALKRFGWTCGPEFWQRYYSDPWVFNLANAVERLTEDLRLATIDQAIAEADANDALDRTQSDGRVPPNSDQTFAAGGSIES